MLVTATLILWTHGVTSMGTSLGPGGLGLGLVITEDQEHLPEAAGKPLSRDLIRNLRGTNEKYITYNKLKSTSRVRQPTPINSNLIS